MFKRFLKELKTAFDKTRYFNYLKKKVSSEYFNTFYESRRTFELFQCVMEDKKVYVFNKKRQGERNNKNVCNQNPVTTISFFN